MDGFEYSLPTQVIFGDGAARRCGSFAHVFGERVLIVCGSRSARAAGALGDVTASLGEAGVHTEILEGVPPNPGTSLVDAGSTLAASTNCDVVVAIGGGSVLDAAKAMAVGAAMNLPFRDFLGGTGSELRAEVQSSLPVIGVPTMLGSGSETNGTSVIVDDVTGRKLSAHSELACPRVALLDPRYVAAAPRDLIAAGCADALCHAIEATLSTRASVASDAFSHAAVRMLLDHAESAVAGTDEAIAQCMWASNLASQALSLAGSIATHPLAHPLSARCGAHHGESVAALEPVVLAVLAGRFGDRAVLLSDWMGGKATHSLSAVSSIVTQLSMFNASLGVTRSASELGLSPEIVDTLVDDALASGSRGLRNTPGGTIGVDEARQVYAQALSSAPAGNPKELLRTTAAARRLQ